MTNEEKIRKYIRGIINELLDEMSTTAGVPGYQTPHAFKKKDDEEEDDDEKIADKVEKIDEGRTRYHKLKNDQSRTAKKKIADSIREAKKSIREVKKILKVISKYKNEFGYSHEQYWKSTQKNIYKMEQDLLAVSQKLKELRS